MAAIQVSGVAKAFRIPSERRETVREHVMGVLRPRRFETLRVLDDVSFELNDGETLGIMGRNGCGKSTLLKIIAGVYLPDRGAVTTRGPVTPILELGVGWNPELDAVDNVLLIGTVMGLPLADLQRSMDDILSFAELHRFSHLELKHFSSGMAARLAYSVAFHAVKGVLILDEIFAVGDAGFRRRCEERFQRLRADGHPAIIVSHDPRTIADFTDRAIFLENGRIAGDGPPGEIARRYVSAVDGSRPVATARHNRPRHAAILLYHRVGEPSTDLHQLSIGVDALRAQMSCLREQFQPLPLEQMLDGLESGDLPDRAVAVTFDDGYLDNLTAAAPILDEFEIPATFFLTTERLEDDYEYWWDLLERILLTPGERLPNRLSLCFGDDTCDFDTSDRPHRESAFWSIYAQLVTYLPPARDRVLERIVEWSGCDGRPPRQNLRMKAADIKRLAAHPRFTIGAHTVRHLRLPEHPLELQREEIERSRSALATLTQQPIRAFAYPNGAFSDRTIDAVRIAGCAVAVTTGEGIVSAETNRLLLPRLWVKPSIGTAFGEWLGGWTSATVSVTG